MSLFSPETEKSHRVGFSFDLSHCLPFFGSQTSSKENVDERRSSRERDVKVLSSRADAYVCSVFFFFGVSAPITSSISRY